MKDSIRRRLETTVERFEEVGALLSDPEVIGKQSRFRDLSMEYARLEPVDHCGRPVCREHVCAQACGRQA